MARNQSDTSKKKTQTTTKAKRSETTRKAVATPSTVSRVHEASDLESTAEMEWPSSGDGDSLSPSPKSSAQTLDPTSATGKDSQDTIHRRIAERAFRLYLDGGCEHGRDLEHWFDAERDIRRNTHEPNG